MRATAALTTTASSRMRTIETVSRVGLRFGGAGALSQPFGANG